MTSGGCYLFGHGACNVSYRMAEMLAAHIRGEQPISLIPIEQATARALMQRGWLRLSGNTKATLLTNLGLPAALRAQKILSRAKVPA